MAKQASASNNTEVKLLPLDPNLPPEQLLMNLRMNALLAHQVSVGRGDALVQILRRTLEQMEHAHGRIQTMNIILFAAGLVLLAVGVIQIVFGARGQEVWAALLGGTGGVATLAATFWTAPLDRMSDSVADLVKLEAAFLGYIRVVGELDSAFQMQYLDTLAGKSNISLDQVINDTTSQMKAIMEHTLTLIDKFVVGQGRALTELQKQTVEMEKRLIEVEGKLQAKP